MVFGIVKNPSLGEAGDYVHFSSTTDLLSNDHEVNTLNANTYGGQDKSKLSDFVG